VSDPVGGDLVRVALIEEEVVGEGGPRTVFYSVRHNAGWLRASAHPTATVEVLSRGPGVVFRRRATLLLAPGTELERVATAPSLRAKSALEHLTQGARGPGRRRSATRLRVTARAGLEPTK